MKRLGILAVVLVLVPVAAWAGTKVVANRGYDGSTSILLPWADQDWLLINTSVVQVREIDLAVIGAQAGNPSDTVRWPREFGCWFSPDPSQPYLNYTPIGMVDFMPEPKVNSTRNDWSVVFPANIYGDGLPSPDGTTAIVCGWDPPGHGYPPLVGGYARAHIFYREG